MGTGGGSDHEVIARLHEKAERLERLETRLEALERERKYLVDSKEQLSSQLENYHRSLKEWEWFFENSVQMLCIAGLDGYLRRVNSAFANTLGYTRDEVVLYLIDIDGFKAVNDQYGHMTGDHLLQVIAKRFREIQRADEMVARLGGDEFAFLVSGSTDNAGHYPHEPLAERIIAQVKVPVELSEGSVTVGCSVGIATFPETAQDFCSLVSQADRAMYATKKSGKNGFRKFDPSLA